MYKDRNVVAQLVRRAERAGFKAIALTVDTPRLGRREADIKNRYAFHFASSNFVTGGSHMRSSCLLTEHVTSALSIERYDCQ